MSVQDNLATTVQSQLEIRHSPPGRAMNPTISAVHSLDAEIFARITEAIRSVSEKARDVVITSQSMLQEDLALDSLDLVAVIIKIQDRFQVEIDPDEITAMRRVEDIAAGLTKQLRAAA
jgi:acyl carrier protein